MTIRTHATEITFGDPLYVEVTILNLGKEPVTAQETYHSDRLRFEIRHGDSGQIIRKLDAEGRPSPLTFRPGKAATFHQFFCVPDLHLIDHPYWSSGRRDTEFYYICGVYTLDNKGLELRSQWQDLVVHARDAEELRFLERWAWADPHDIEKGPRVANAALHLHAMNRFQTAQVRSGVQSGEIADLLDLTIRMQNIYQGPPVVPTASNRELVEWLSKMPDIKRQALAKEAHDMAHSHRKMSSTVDALLPLFKDQ